MMILWFQENQDWFPLPLKCSNSVYKQKVRSWELVAEETQLQSEMVKFTEGSSLPCFALSDVMCRPVRVPASRRNGVRPPHAQPLTKTVGGRKRITFSPRDRRKNKKPGLLLQGRSPNLRKIPLCYCRLLIKHCLCLWPIFNLFCFYGAFLRYYNFLKSYEYTQIC